MGNCVVDKWGDCSADNCIWEQSPLVVAHKFWEHGNNICQVYMCVVVYSKHGLVLHKQLILCHMQSTCIISCMNTGATEPALSICFLTGGYINFFKSQIPHRHQLKLCNTITVFNNM